MKMVGRAEVEDVEWNDGEGRTESAYGEAARDEKRKAVQGWGWWGQVQNDKRVPHMQRLLR